MGEPATTELPIPDEFICGTRYAYHKSHPTAGGVTVEYTYNEATGLLVRKSTGHEEASCFHVMATEIFMVGRSSDDAPDHIYLEYI